MPAVPYSRSEERYQERVTPFLIFLYHAALEIKRRALIQLQSRARNVIEHGWLESSQQNGSKSNEKPRNNRRRGQPPADLNW